MPKSKDLKGHSLDLDLLSVIHDFMLMEIEDDEFVVVSASEDFRKTLVTHSFEEIIIRDHFLKLKKALSTAKTKTKRLDIFLRNPINDSSLLSCSFKKEGDKKKLLVILKPDEGDSIEFIQNAAHDLRSPINSMLGLTSLAQSMLSEKQPNIGELKNVITHIKTACDQSLVLTSDILELARLESRQFSLEVVEVVLNDFIENYIRTHKLLVMKKKIDIKYDSTEGGTVKINEAMITRVLDNIVSNSVKFSKPSSSIYIDLVPSKKHICLKIRDEGIGMPKEVKDGLFKKFGKSQRRGLEGEDSHGLGMSIVRQILDLHKAKIEVQSAEGEGTEINILFKKS